MRIRKRYSSPGLAAGHVAIPVAVVLAAPSRRASSDQSLNAAGDEDRLRVRRPDPEGDAGLVDDGPHPRVRSRVRHGVSLPIADSRRAALHAHGSADPSVVHFAHRRHGGGTAKDARRTPAPSPPSFASLSGHPSGCAACWAPGARTTALFALRMKRRVVSMPAPAAAAIRRVLARPDHVPVGSGRRGEERVRHARDGQVGAEVDEQQPFVGGLVREEPQQQRLGAEDRPVDPVAFARRPAKATVSRRSRRRSRWSARTSPRSSTSDQSRRQLSKVADAAGSGSRDRAAGSLRLANCASELGAAFRDLAGQARGPDRRRSGTARTPRTPAPGTASASAATAGAAPSAPAGAHGSPAHAAASRAPSWRPDRGSRGR